MDNANIGSPKILSSQQHKKLAQSLYKLVDVLMKRKKAVNKKGLNYSFGTDSHF